MSRAFPFINVEGSVNLRDFGGYQTTEGQIVKQGLLFRCGNMAEIPEHAHDDFAALDIGVICDLRSHDEADSAPSPETGPFACRVHIPIWPGSSSQFQESVKDRRPEKAEFEAFMRRVTREIALEHLPSYEQLLNELLNTDRGFLLHCSAGKDRTGIGAAIILSALGVDEDTILKDYLISNQATELYERTLRRMMENAAEQNFTGKMDESIVEIFAGVRAEYLTETLSQIKQEFGAFSNYLTALGLTASDQQELKARLLE